MNKAIIIGRLGADPELRQVGEQTVCSLRVATSDRWTDRDGQRQERTEWHRVTVWGKLADLCGRYLAKGREVMVEGQIETREWVDKEGQKRFTTEIKAREVEFLGGRDGGGEPEPRREREPRQEQRSQAPAGRGRHDDIPF